MTDEIKREKGRPFQPPGTQQETKMRPTMSKKDKEFLTECAREMDIPLGVMLKNFMKRYMKEHTIEDAMKETWLKPDCDTCLPMAIHPEDKIRLEAYTSAIKNTYGNFMVQVAMKYLKRRKKK